MCLSIPCKVVSIENDKAVVSIGGNLYEASLQLVDDVKVGDYVLLHAGFVIQKLNEDEAYETFELLKQICELDDTSINNKS
ncbi:MAG: HypC/HybG/HupF family hydrogenase formation chaperone [Bacteroidales bacterium]|nr:HypC/HybG/HupF family hydrogenase formation chaperone [Bacteroidales bacterium]